MNRLLKLPPWSFGDVVESTVADPLGGPDLHLPVFTPVPKVWTGVPLKSADAVLVPVAWTLERLAQSSWNFDDAFFPSVGDYTLANVPDPPATAWGEQGTLVRKPRAVFLNGLMTADQAATLLAPILPALAEKRVFIDVRESTSPGEVAPFALAGLPMSGWTGVTDTFNVGGVPATEAHYASVTTPAQWAAGEALHFCIAGFNGSGGYIPAGDVGSRLTNFLDADGDRVNADLPQYDKFGIHLITSHAVASFSAQSDANIQAETDIAIADPQHGQDPAEGAAGDAAAATIPAVVAAVNSYNATDPCDPAALQAAAGLIISTATAADTAFLAWLSAIVTAYGSGTDLEVKAGSVEGSLSGVIIPSATGAQGAAADAAAKVADFEAHVAELLAAVAPAVPTSSAMYHGDCAAGDPFPDAILADIVDAEIIPKIIEFFGL